MCDSERIAAPLDAAEFADLMNPFGPFATGRRVMVAVSGGVDSMALAFLASRWGTPRAAIVDHGLRPEAAAEAALTAERLAAIGIEAVILRAHLSPGPAAAERARDARYRLLLEACRDAGTPDLLIAHHAGDQAETVRMRHDAGSATAGLAGMSAIAYRDDARLLRPLLTVPKSRLRVTLRDAGLSWVEDPTNHDTRSLRARLRATMGPADIAAALAAAHAHGLDRAAAERALAAELAAVAFHPAGFATVSSPLSEQALAAVIWAIAGRTYPPSRAALCAGLATRSVHGVLLRPARRGAATLVMREPAAAAAPVQAAPGVVWDGRFRVTRVPDSLEIGALGPDAARIGRRSGLPALIRRALPVLRRDGEIVAVPHLGFPDAETCRSVSVLFCPSRPAAPAPFVNAS